MYKILHIPTGTFLYTYYHGIFLYSEEERQISSAQGYKLFLFIVNSFEQFKTKFYASTPENCPKYFGIPDYEISHYELIEEY